MVTGPGDSSREQLPVPALPGPGVAPAPPQAHPAQAAASAQGRWEPRKSIRVVQRFSSLCHQSGRLLGCLVPGTGCPERPEPCPAARNTSGPQPRSCDCVCGFRATWQELLTVTHLPSKGKRSFPAPFNSSNTGLSRGKEPPAWHRHPALAWEGPQCCAAVTGCTCVTHNRGAADGAVCPIPPRKATVPAEVAGPAPVRGLCRALLQPRWPGPAQPRGMHPAGSCAWGYNTF